MGAEPHGDEAVSRQDMPKAFSTNLPTSGKIWLEIE